MDLTEQLQNCYTGAVYDVLRELGLTGQVLPPGIVAVNPGQRLAGPVFTVSGHFDATLDPRETLLRWTELLSAAPSGCVVVCQPNDATLAHMGELSAETLQSRGVRGYIVDGGCRDVDFIRSIGFPVFCRYFTPADVVGRWVADALGEPIAIGDVRIEAGDYVLADRDGVVVIPGAIADEVINRATAHMQTENLVRTAIRSGVDPKEAYLQFGVF